MLETGVRDCGVVECEFPETGETADAVQSVVRDLGPLEKNLLQAGEIAEMLEAGAGDLRVPERQLTQVGKTAEVLQPGIRDRRVLEEELFQAGESIQVLQATVGHLRAVQTKERNLLKAACVFLAECVPDEVMQPAGVARFRTDLAAELLDILEPGALRPTAPLDPEADEQQRRQQSAAQPETAGAEPVSRSCVGI